MFTRRLAKLERELDKESRENRRSYHSRSRSRSRSPHRPSRHDSNAYEHNSGSSGHRREHTSSLASPGDLSKERPPVRDHNADRRLDSAVSITSNPITNQDMDSSILESRTSKEKF
ncbi:hypothetical protein ABEB36_014819 [Hypothenemus hampei]|uniref:Uncharacterized protein n=1 Tax=Hypothenemus hampei TaxID=57062 RepID=A0ABD1E318_HYPHA